MRTCIRALLVLGLVLGLAACGSDTEVGSGVDTEVGDPGDAPRLGERLTTTTLAPISTAPQGGQLARVSTTAPPAPRAGAATTAPQSATLEVSIYGDDSSHTAFEPTPASVYVGGYVKFVNRDRVARRVIEDAGKFDSQPIPPGGSWTYRVTQAGTFNYHDDTRPHARGSLEVIAR
jgi:plastocyanin